MRIAFLLLIASQTSFADSSAFFAEVGGTFSLKSGTRVLDDRGGVLRAGVAHPPTLLMGGVTARGAKVEASDGNAFAIGNFGIFTGLTVFQRSPFRIRFFLPLSYGRVRPDAGASQPVDDAVFFFEPEAQLSYRFVKHWALGFGLNRRFALSFDGEESQRDDMEKLMFTGSFSYELPF